MSDAQLLRLTVQLDGTHPKHPDYPLLPGDVLTRDCRDDTYVKHTGLGMFGFVLTDEQVATLEPVDGQIVLVGSVADSLSSAEPNGVAPSQELAENTEANPPSEASPSSRG